MDLLYPFFFLKSEGSQEIPYSPDSACPISLIFAAFFRGLMVRVVAK